MERIIIYGAGKMGEWVYEYLKDIYRKNSYSERNG